MTLPLPSPGAGGFTLRALKEGSDYTNSLLKNELQSIINRYQPQDSESILSHRNALANRTNTLAPLEADQMRISNEWTPRLNASNIAHTNALTKRDTSMLPFDIDKARIDNEWAPKLNQSRIDSEKSMEKWRASGGSGGGVGAKDWNMFTNFVSKDNPNLNEKQVYEAANVLANGGNSLSDGTPLNPMSFAAESALDRASKARSTGTAQTQLITANQAEAELEAISKYTTDKLSPYGTTYMNYSTDQIIDSFKNDDASQNRLGDFIGSQGLQYEAAQIRNRIAGGEPGISATNELMGQSGQIINKLYPRLSAKARKRAIEVIDEGLKKGLDARKKIGVGASQLYKKQNSSDNEKKDKKVIKVINGKTYQQINGKVYEV